MSTSSTRARIGTALVTGGSQGFGLALTAALTAGGATVLTDARDGARLRATVGTLAHPDRVRAVPGDLTDPRHRAEIAAAAQDLGGLDLVVHNAGALGPGLAPVADYPVDAFRDVLEANVVAPLALTRLVLPLLRPGAAIVALSSDAAVEAYPGWGGYGASKAALDHLVAVLAAELGETVSVYAFDPGDMRTEMHRRAYPGEDVSDRPEPAEAVPALLHLLGARPASGRYRGADLLAGSAS